LLPAPFVPAARGFCPRVDRLAPRWPGLLRPRRCRALIPRRTPPPFPETYGAPAIAPSAWPAIRRSFATTACPALRAFAGAACLLPPAPPGSDPARAPDPCKLPWYGL